MQVPEAHRGCKGRTLRVPEPIHRFQVCLECGQTWELHMPPDFIWPDGGQSAPVPPDAPATRYRRWGWIPGRVLTPEEIEAVQEASWDVA